MSDQSQPTPAFRRLRLWPWFAIGFFVCFAVLAAVLPMYFYNGLSLYRVKLWRYYVLTIRQTMNQGGTLGPTSGDYAAMLKVALEHVACSLVAGAAALAFGWFLEKLSARRRA